MILPSRPLPESLTRLLDSPAAQTFAPTPGDRRRGDPLPQHRPLEVAILRGLVGLCALMVWAAILWGVVRHLAR